MSTPNEPDEGQDPDQTVFRPRVPEGGLVPPTGAPAGPPPPITGIPSAPQGPPPGPTGPPSWQQQPTPQGPPSWQQQPGPTGPPSWQQQPTPQGPPSWQQQPGPAGPPSWQQQPGQQQPPQQPSWVRADAPGGHGAQQQTPQSQSPQQQGQPWADQTIARPGTQPAWQQPGGPPEKKTVSRTPVLVGFGVLALVVIGLIVALVVVLLGSGGDSSKSLAPASASPSKSRSATTTNGPLRSAADITKYLYVPPGFTAAPAGDAKNRADGLATDAKADTKVDFAVGMAWVDASGNAYIVLVEHFKTAATSQMLSSLPDQAMKGAGASDVQEVNARERVGTLTGTLPGSVDALIRTDVLILAALQNGTHDQVSQYVGKQAALLPGP